MRSLLRLWRTCHSFEEPVKALQSLSSLQCFKTAPKTTLHHPPDKPATSAPFTIQYSTKYASESKICMHVYIKILFRRSLHYHFCYCYNICAVTVHKYYNIKFLCDADWKKFNCYIISITNSELMLYAYTILIAAIASK